MLKRLTQLDKEDDLMPDERVIRATLQSWWAEIRNIFLSTLSFLIFSFFLTYYFFFSDGKNLLFLLLSIIFLLGFLFLTTIIFLGHYSIRYCITDKRVLVKKGIISKHVISIGYEKVTDIQLKKNVYENLIDIGDIWINVAGSNEIELKIENVRDPENFYQLIMKLMQGTDEKKVNSKDLNVKEGK